MMRVGDRDSERVGGVGASDFHAGKQSRHHGVDLRFVRTAGADDRFFHQGRRIFPDGDSAPARAEKRDAARLAQFQGRLRVLVDEYFLDSGGVGAVLGENRLELLGETGQTLRQRG